MFSTVNFSVLRQYIRWSISPRNFTFRNCQLFFPLRCNLFTNMCNRFDLIIERYFINVFHLKLRFFFLQSTTAKLFIPSEAFQNRRKGDLTVCQNLN